MTAPSTPDLAARILAAIDEAERSEHSRRTIGEPRLSPCPHCGATLGSWSRYGDPAPWQWRSWRSADGAATYEMEPCRCPLTWEQFCEVTNAQPCPDEAVLRRCAADRRILELHRQVEADTAGHGLNEPMGCVTCHNDPDCGWTLGNGVCDTVLVLAEGYGIEVGGARG